LESVESVFFSSVEEFSEEESEEVSFEFEEVFFSEGGSLL